MSNATTDIATFAHRVLCAARRTEAQWAGQPLIVDVWAAFSTGYYAGFNQGMTLDTFKAALVAAHQERGLVLSRCDLPEAYAGQRAAVVASETEHYGATFHFVCADR